MRESTPAEVGSSTGAATMSVPEAGALLGISRNSAYAAVKRGELPVIRLGSRLVVPREAIARMLEGAAPTE